MWRFRSDLLDLGHHVPVDDVHVGPRHAHQDLHHRLRLLRRETCARWKTSIRNVRVGRERERGTSRRGKEADRCPRRAAPQRACRTSSSLPQSRGWSPRHVGGRWRRCSGLRSQRVKGHQINATRSESVSFRTSTHLNGPEPGPEPCSTSHLVLEAMTPLTPEHLQPPPTSLLRSF